MLETLKKAGHVLDLFAEGRSDLGVSEVADALQVPKSGAHAILTTLMKIGLLEQTNDRRYRLGWHCLALSRALLDTTDIRKATDPVAVRLARQVEGVAQLAVLERDRALCIDVYGPYGSTLKHRLGVTKAGDYLPDYHPLARVLLKSWTNQPLAEERADRHYADELLGSHRDVYCGAALIESYDQAAIGALCLSVPHERFPESIVRKAALGGSSLIARQLSRMDSEKPKVGSRSGRDARRIPEPSQTPAVPRLAGHSPFANPERANTSGITRSTLPN